MVNCILSVRLKDWMVEFVAEHRNKKIVKYKKPLQFNIGIAVFAVVFLYLLYYVYAFFTTEQVSVYEVKQGTIAQDTLFEGLILRDETVNYASDNGYVNYYYKDGSRASAGSYVYSVDETGDFYHRMTADNNGQLKLSDEAYRQLEGVADQYLSSSSDMEFHQVYQFKYDMEAALVEALNANARSEIGDMPQEAGALGLHTYRAQEAGVVVYHTDGLEDVTADTVTDAMFDKQNYQRNNFLNREKVSAGEAVYKIITSEIWQVVIPISSQLAADLGEESNIQVEFQKDHSTAWATSQVLFKDGRQYLLLEFSNSMVRFASDRFVELRLLLTDTSGLKIPNSAITSKDFFTVPKEYVTKGGNTNKDGLIVERINEDGENATEFDPVTLFFETETSYYIDGEKIGPGDVVIKPDSTERFRLDARSSLEGVYNINKGYAVFKRIEKLFENEEYTIVKSGTPYGISIYDHIALSSSSVKEDDILH